MTLPFAIGALAALVGVLSGFELIDPTALIAVMLGGIAIVLIRAGASLHRTYLHPSLVLGSILIAAGVCGFFIYPLVAAEGLLPTLFQDEPHPSRLHTLIAFLAFGCAALASTLVPGKTATLGSLTAALRAQPRLVRRLLIGFLVLATGAYLVGTEPSALLLRESYLAFVNEGVVEVLRLGTGLELPAAFIGFVLVLSGSLERYERIVAVGCLCLLVILDFATASRTLGVLPLLYLGARWLTRGSVSARVVAVTATLALIGLSMALYLRAAGLGEHGLLPYVVAVFSDPVQAATSRIPDVTANLLLGFPTTSYIRDTGVVVDGQSLWNSINPLPATYTGYEADDYRIVSFFPYNTVGMLSRLGIPVGMIYFSVVGLVLAGLWRVAGSSAARATLVRPLMTSAAGAIAIYSLQYPLRTSVRIAELAIVAAAAAFLVAYFATSRRVARRSQNHRAPGSLDRRATSS